MIYETRISRPPLHLDKKTSQLTIRLMNAERGAFDELAADADLPVSTYVVTVLRAHLADHERP